MEDQVKSTSNARLASLEASAGGRVVWDGYLVTNSYEVIVPNSQDSIKVIAKADDPNAVITIDGASSPNGEPSESIPLELGLNKFDVVVTAADGETQARYLFKVQRQYPMPNWAEVLEEGPFVRRDSSGEMVFKDRMWLLGGYVPEVIGDIWSSADGMTWENDGELPDGNTVNVPVCFVHDGKMWVVSYQGRLYSSEDGKNWILVNENMPGTGRGCGEVLNGRMWFVGGADGREVWSSIDGVDWKQEVAQAPWSRRSHFGNFVAYAGKLWVIGGALGRYQPFKAYNDVWSSPDGVNWTLVTDRAPWQSRRWTCCVVYRNRIWQLGGFRGQPNWTNLNDVWYTADGKNWKQLITDDVWSERHELSGYVHNDRLWVVAGNAWPLMNDVWQLHIPGMTFITQPVLEEYVGARYEYRAEAEFNESAGAISYRLIESPEWLQIEKSTGVISGTPPATGEYPVVVEAYDDAGETARQSYILSVVVL